jgi:hypothetical protein
VTNGVTALLRILIGLFLKEQRLLLGKAEEERTTV